MGKQPTVFILNGVEHVAKAGVPNLLSYLRDELRLLGTKCGCSVGDCGACTVLIDGVPTKSCLVKVSTLRGKTVETIEHLATDGELHPLQQAFINYGAVQCGFCTPGMVMAAKGLLDRTVVPTDQEIIEALRGNLCRCTGYVSIIEAVKAAAAHMRGEKTLEAYSGPTYGPGTLIGVSLPDRDGSEKVTGRFKFAGDLFEEGMLYGKILLPKYPHAEIELLDVSEARKIPGVVAVITAEDVPGVNAFGLIKPERPAIASERVRYIGEPLAVVFAESEKIAQKAVNKITVQYRPLPVYSTPEESMHPDAHPLHPDGNIFRHIKYDIGDINAGFDQSDIILEDSFSTARIEHVFMEPEAGMARPTEEGGVEVWYCTQLPAAIREEVIRCTGLPDDKVRIRAVPAGGGHGGKTDPTIEVLLALGALQTGRPVKMTLTRRESFKMGLKRHPYSLEYKIGASKDGTLRALQAKLISDGGAYSGLSPFIIETSMILSGGPYFWPNALVEGYTVRTNNVLSGPFRGFGVPQVAFAIESMMDMMARKLGMDPFELRLKNALDVGSYTLAGEKLRTSVGIKETLTQARDRLKTLLPEMGNRKIGVGVASSMEGLGTGKGRTHDVGGAIFELREDGRIRFCNSSLDMGQGSRTILCQLAAEATGIDYHLFDLDTGDTDVIPPGAFAIGQRQTFLVGNATVEAGKDFKEKIIAAAADMFNMAPTNVMIQGDSLVDKTENDRKIATLKQLADRLGPLGESIRSEYNYQSAPTYPIILEGEKPPDYRNYIAYGYVTHVALVEVNEKTGAVNLLHLIAAHDLGKLLNPLKVKGQVEGAAVMGLGYALSEQFIMEKGLNKTRRISQCGIPTIEQTPELSVLIIEDPDPDGPFGAKGISELALAPVAPAMMNAIYDATGIRIKSLPATPDKILATLAK